MNGYTEHLIYENPLASAKDTESFILEGQASVTFPEGRMRLQNILNPTEGQKSNFVYWCDRDFPSNIKIQWDFWPIEEPGLAMMFLAARGQNGEDIFAPNIAKREGPYGQYNKGDINTFHIAYFRRVSGCVSDGLYICNLRKSYGAHIVATGADPIPPVDKAVPPYHMEFIKFKNKLSFSISGIPILSWFDNGASYGKPLEGGKIGFRQMAPLIADYSNFKVYELK